MFRVALILFKHTLRADVLPECPTLYETMERLRHIPPEYMQEEFIVREVIIGGNAHKTSMTAVWDLGMMGYQLV